MQPFKSFVAACGSYCRRNVRNVTNQSHVKGHKQWVALHSSYMANFINNAQGGKTAE